jgi:hypothetical protein
MYMKLNAGFPWHRRHSARRKLFSPSQWTYKQETVKYFIWSITLYDAWTWTLREIGQKYLESYEMRCRRRMEKIVWTNRVENEEE